MTLKLMCLSTTRIYTLHYTHSFSLGLANMKKVASVSVCISQTTTLQLAYNAKFEFYITLQIYFKSLNYANNYELIYINLNII